MPTRRLTTNAPGAVAVALTALLTVSACGSGPTDASFDTAFVDHANAICADAVAKHDGASLPVANFDPLHPRAQDLPAIGTYFARYGSAAGTVARLDALAAPRKRANDWTKLRALLDSVAANAQQQIAAAEKSDVASFETTVHTARTLATQIDRVAPKVGFTSSSPCKEVFG